ncbi:hypothetical protein ANN_00123 [Periplaneta americana]|uniref:Uncharacterized protein n=1 Tax=Periplaneta americana TaxID=6978 RepID=A0ABQ8TRQ7_PERAM|nr:hypothetical protein ANN_00123 [Periplaneta americana]
MAGLCEGGNEPPGSLKATRERPRPTSRLLASRPHAEAEVDDHPTRMETFGRPRRRWEDNIKMDLREVGYDDRDWINLAQDRDQ